mmetsp:Transcript_37969/g.90869  ORF Transcript_37969/g.90869 Transcript_37969/m.90869 type:complete len:421 (-) Transcript_37969:244-1506(-)
MRRRFTSSSVGISLLAAASSMASESAALQIPTLSLRTFRAAPSSERDDDGGTAGPSPAGPSLEEASLDMPIIGLGTYKFKKGTGEVSRAIGDALRAGYRHIDTAFVYGGEKTEGEIGEALSSLLSRPGRDSPPSAGGIGRSDLFLTSKQWRAYHGYEPTLKCLDLSLRRLRTDYLDLYLIHWPGPAYNTMARSRERMELSPDGPFVYAKDGHGRDELAGLRSETWRAMEDALFRGKVRSIGVSNFTVGHLESLKRTARVWPPAVNQIELHPYNPQTELVDYCRREGIAVQAYASLGRQDAGRKSWSALGGKLLERTEVADVAERHGRAPAQVLLRWATQRGLCVIPKSTDAGHMRMNLEAVSDGGGGFRLSREDMEAIDSLDQSRVDVPSSDGSGVSGSRPNEKARLCWVRDPLKMLDFD